MTTGGRMTQWTAAVAVGAVLACAVVWSQEQPPAAAPPAPSAPLGVTVAPDIPGVIRGGTKVVLLRAGFRGTEAAIAMPDGSLLFAEYDANRILKVERNDRISLYLEDSNGTIGLAYDPAGRLVGTQMGMAMPARDPLVGILVPARTALAERFDGQPLSRPNDLVIDRKGGIYFTDTIPPARLAFRPPPPGRTPLLFYIRPDGQLVRLTDYVKTPNGIQLSPDEKTLYATNGQTIAAFDVQPDGSVTNPRTFAMSGGDGMAVDEAGRLYSAVGAVQGVRVFSPQGQDLGTIPVGIAPQSVAFAGPEKKTLYIVGRGAVYKTDMIARGLTTRAK